MYLFFTNCCQKCHILSESLMLMCFFLFRFFGWLVLVGFKLVVSVLFLSLEKMRSFRSWVLSLAMLSFEVVGGSRSMLITSVVWCL